MEANEQPQELNGEQVTAQLGTKDVYQTDALGFFMYQTIANELALAPGHFNIPFGAYEEKPLPAPAGMVSRRVAGQWAHVEDHRTDVLYYEQTPGAEDQSAVVLQYQIGQVVEVGGVDVSYDGGGPLPEWLTDVAPVITPPSGGDLPGGAET